MLVLVHRLITIVVFTTVVPLNLKHLGHQLHLVDLCQANTLYRVERATGRLPLLAGHLGLSLLKRVI